MTPPHPLSFKLAWDASVSQFTADLPWAMIALAIMVTTCLVVFFIVYCGECCMRKPRSNRYLQAHRLHDRDYRGSLARIFVLVVAALLGAGGFWIAATTFGVSFWNIIFTYGIVTLLISTIFGTTLALFGAYVSLAFTGKPLMNRYITFDETPQIHGRVVAFNILWIELEYEKGPAGVGYRYVPTLYFIARSYDVRES